MATAPARAPVASAATGAVAPQSYMAPLSILTSLFFMWGFLTCLNDVLIPHLKAAFSLTYAEAGLIQFAFFMAYFIVSLPAGVLVKKIGYQRGIVIGLLLAGAGCLLFYPAAGLRVYGLFLGALFILASGITILQVAANPYVAALGPTETSSSRLTLTQAFNSIGTLLAPSFGAAFILAQEPLPDADLAKLSAADLATYRATEAAAVQHPYLGLAAVLICLSIAMGLLSLPKIVEGPGEPGGLAGTDDRGSAWRYPHLVLGMVAIFVYVGGEVSVGSFLVNFLHQPDIADLPVKTASRFLMVFWGGAAVGRLVGSFALRRVRPGVVLAINGAVASSLIFLTMLIGGNVAMWTILAVGLFNSIMFPTIFSLALAGLGRHSEQGSGILCLGIVGGALLPYVQGSLADHYGLRLAFIVPALCYFYIVYYGLKGSHHASRAPMAPAA